MTLLSIPALYDGTGIRLLEPVPYQKPYRVVVTFIEPIAPDENPVTDLARFWGSFGAWKDDASLDDTIRFIKESRSSRTEPPIL